MIGGLLRLASTAATVLVVLGFALFAIEETREGSAATVSRIADASASDAEHERTRESGGGGLREAIYDANDFLLAPFDEVVAGSDSQWVRHGIPAVLGFLLYGLFLRMLANIPQSRRPEPLGWDVPR